MFKNLLLYDENLLKKKKKLSDFLKWIFLHLDDFIIPPFYCLPKIHKYNFKDIKSLNGRP